MTSEAKIAPESKQDQLFEEQNPLQCIKPLKCYSMSSKTFNISQNLNENQKRLFIPKENIKMSQNGVVIDFSLKQRIVQSFRDYNLDEQILSNDSTPLQMNDSISNHPNSHSNIFDMNDCYLAEISSAKILLRNKKIDKREYFARQNSESTIADFQSCIVNQEEHTTNNNNNQSLIRLRNRLGLNTDVFWKSAFEPVLKKDFMRKRQIFDKTTMEPIQQKDEIHIKSSVLFHHQNDNISYNDEDDFKEDVKFSEEEQYIYGKPSPKKKSDRNNKRKSHKKSRGRKTGINLYDDGYYHCPFCERVFTQGQQLGGHCSRAHPGQSKIYQAKMEKRRIYYQSLPNYYQTFSKNKVNEKKKSCGVRKRV